MNLTSDAFQSGEMIPKQFTCDGPDISPALCWVDSPADTLRFALIVDDPDAPAGTWVHWLLYDLAGDNKSLAENLPKTEKLSNGARQGRNDFGRIGYGGPCPPPGKPHRYFFKLYALDTEVGLEAGATKAEVEKAIEGHVLARAELMGQYGR